MSTQISKRIERLGLAVVFVLSIVGCPWLDLDANAQDANGADPQAVAQQDEQLKKLQEKLAKATERQLIRPTEYVDALLQLAVFYRQTKKDKAQGDQEYKEALSFYADHQDHGSHPYHQFCRYLVECGSEPDFDKRFHELLLVCEKSKYANDVQLDSATASMVSQLANHVNFDSIHLRDPKEREDALKDARAKGKRIWKDLIAVRSSIAGNDDKSLVRPYEYYSNLCVADDPKDAEQAILKADSLTPPSNTNAAAESKLKVAEFYLKQKAYDKADQYWKAAIQSAFIDQSTRENYHVYDTFFRYIAKTSQQPDFDKRFCEFLTTCEKAKQVDDAQLDRAISEMTSQLRNQQTVQNVHLQDSQARVNADKSARQTMKQIWKNVIATRSSVRGSNDKSLIEPYEIYARFCAADDPKEAEQAVLKADSLTPQSNTTAAALSKIRVAQFYIKQKVFDKAEQYWRAAIQINHNEIDSSIERSLDGLAQAYKRADRPTDMFKIADTLLSSGNGAKGNGVDELTNQIVDDCIRAGQIPIAEAWLKKRLTMAEKATDDPETNNWRIRLSDAELAEGKTVESEKLYQQVLQSQALQGISTDLLRQRRAELLERLGRTHQAATIKANIPPAPKGEIHIQYVLLGLQEIRLGHNSIFQSYDSAAARAFPTIQHTEDLRICSAGGTRVEGNLIFSGTIYGPVRPASARYKQNSAPKISMLIPALDPPTTAKDLEDVHGMLVPGDYVWHNGNNLNLAGLPQGKIRFFLVDKSNSNASWNIPFTTPGMQKPAENIQFWYGGTRKLVLGPWVTGVIYAPNAEVSLPFNGQFTGAIVANRITGAGNNTYSFDKALLNARF